MTTGGNRFLEACSRSESVSGAMAELENQLGDLTDAPSLAVLFVSPHHIDAMAELTRGVAEKTGTETLIGCTGESIVAGKQEIEHEPAIALWMAWLPDASVDLMHLNFERTADGGVIRGWPELPPDWPAGSTLLVLGDPFSFPAELLLERINEDQPGTQVLGGMASGGFNPGSTRVVVGDKVESQGAAAVLLRNVPVRTVVSQGCRPIGDTFVITQAEGNVIQGLGGRPAQTQLQRVYEGLPNCDKELVHQGIHLGRVVNEYQERFSYGDFLIRNVTGANPDDGGLVVGDYMRPGQTVQFHVRDAVTAHEDLQQLLHQARTQATRVPAGALVFTCNGRGERLFAEPHHDAGLLAEVCGELPTVGFFCQGEIGPVGGKNFLHGFTASIGLFE